MDNDTKISKDDANREFNSYCTAISSPGLSMPLMQKIWDMAHELASAHGLSLGELEKAVEGCFDKETFEQLTIYRYCIAEKERKSIYAINPFAIEVHSKILDSGKGGVVIRYGQKEYEFAKGDK